MLSLLAFCMVTVAQANPAFEKWKREAQNKSAQEMVTYLEAEILATDDMEIVKEAYRQIAEIYTPRIDLENRIGKLEDSVCNLKDSVSSTRDLTTILAVSLAYYVGYKALCYLGGYFAESSRNRIDLHMMKVENEALKATNAELLNAQCWWSRKAN